MVAMKREDYPPAVGLEDRFPGHPGFQKLLMSLCRITTLDKCQIPLRQKPLGKAHDVDLSAHLLKIDTDLPISCDRNERPAMGMGQIESDGGII